MSTAARQMLQGDVLAEDIARRKREFGKHVNFTQMKLRFTQMKLRWKVQEKI